MNKYFSGIDFIRVAKIAAGVCLSITAATLLGLQYATSAGIITLLGIQETKKETLSLALKRVAAFFAALVIAFASFTVIGYNIWALGAFLLMFVGLCHSLRIPEVIAMSTVLMIHFWAQKSMAWPVIGNEAALVAVGVGTGILLNLVMPRRTKEIREAQRRIEEAMKKILLVMAEAVVMSSSPDAAREDMDTLKKLIDEAMKRAVRMQNNTLGTDMRYYTMYADMRRRQHGILERIETSLSRLCCAPPHARTLSGFFQSISRSLHECNNAVTLLREFEELRKGFRSDELPRTREEFETRSVLYQIFLDLEHFLLLKKTFVEDLSEEQKRTFWRGSDCPEEQK